MKQDFTAAMNYLALTVANNKGSLQRRNVSKAVTDPNYKKGGKGKGKGKGKGGKLAARNYSPKEWRALSDSDKDKVRKLRAEDKKKRKLAKLEAEKEAKSSEDESESAGEQMSRKKSKKKHG
jgi:hypothetical protein